MEAEYDIILVIGSICIFVYTLGIIELIRLRDSVFIKQTVPTINICICVNYVINTITSFFTTRGPLSCPIYLWAGFLNVLPTVNGFYILGLRWIIVDRLASRLIEQYNKETLLENSNSSIHVGDNELMVEALEALEGRFSIINWLAKKKDSGSSIFAIKLYFISFGVSLVIPLIINLITPQYRDFNQLCEQRITIEVIFLVVIFIVAIALFVYDLIKLRKIKDEYGFKVMLSGVVITWTIILLIFSGISVLDDPIMHKIYKFFSVSIFIVPFGFLVGYPLYQHYRRIGISFTSISTSTDFSDSDKMGDILPKIEIKSQLVNWIEYQLPSSTERPGFESLRVFAARYDSSTDMNRFYRHALSFFDTWKKQMINAGMASIMYQKYIKTKDGRDAFCPMIINPDDLSDVMELWSKMDRLYAETILDTVQIEIVENEFIDQMNKIHQHLEKRLTSELFNRYKLSSFYKEVLQQYKFNDASIV